MRARQAEGGGEPRKRRHAAHGEHRSRLHHQHGGSRKRGIAVGVRHQGAVRAGVFRSQVLQQQFRASGDFNIVLQPNVFKGRIAARGRHKKQMRCSRLLFAAFGMLCDVAVGGVMS
mgnify:CR=1 FL=1